MDGICSLSGLFDEEKHLLPLPGFEPHFLCCPFIIGITLVFYEKDDTGKIIPVLN